MHNIKSVSSNFCFCCFFVVCSFASFTWCTKLQLSEESRYNDLISKIFHIPKKNTFLDSVDLQRTQDYSDDEEAPRGQCRKTICVPNYLCVNGSVLTNGEDLFELKMSSRLDGNDKSVCSIFEIPCCIIDNDDDNDENINTHQVYEDAPSDISEEELFNQEPMVCGYRFNKANKKIESRISGGENAHLGEFPWMIGLFLQHPALPSDQLRYHGGGSLIHPSVILTAAHILINVLPQNVLARAGDYDVLETNEETAHQERNVSNVIVHREFNARTLINDVALLIVSKPFLLTQTVNTICLPPQNIFPDENSRCFASGWGKHLYGRKGKYQATLKKVELPIIGDDECQQQLRSTRLGPHFLLHSSLTCAGGDRKDTCRGDGGSPLVCEISQSNGRYYQSGIVAGGVGCANTAPGIYANVAIFTNWILQQLNYINIHLDNQNLLKSDLFND